MIINLTSSVNNASLQIGDRAYYVPIATVSNDNDQLIGSSLSPTGGMEITEIGPSYIKVSENSFELILRILGNEFVAIKIGSTNFSGKLIAGGVLLLFFTFVIMELFGFDDLLK